MNLRRSWALAAGVLLLAAGAWWILREGPGAAVFREVPARVGGKAERVAGRSPADRLPVAAAMVHGDHRVDCACRGCEAVEAGEPLPRVEVAGGGAAWLAAVEAAGQITLPDGRRLRVLVERSETGPDGGLVMLEGRMEAPAGRFLFRRELVPGKAWPMWGFVNVFGEPRAWRIENEGAKSFLAEVPADLVVCRQFAMPPEETGAAAEDESAEIPANHPTNIAIPSYQNGIIPLQSLPGAAAVLYLDFDGEAGPHEGWGDFDALPAQLSSTPATAISQVKEVWQRVAEDYAPFNINVTTDLQVFLNASGTSRQRCIITPTNTAAPGAGGVAYLNSFDSSGDQPCWVFMSTGKAAAEAISHEFGHTLRLSHDGRISPSEEYYGGHGTDPVGWAPIMGVGYYRNLSQWSKGEYLSANRTQDDVSIIANNNNNIDVRVDGSGDTLATADFLEILANDTVANEGVIETAADVDAFRFKTSGGSVSFTVSQVATGPNLDILAEIRDEAGTVVASANPDTALNATVGATLAAGEYTLQISGVGRGDPLADGYTDYASLGAYTVTGSVTGGEKPDRFSIAENPVAGAAVGTVLPRGAHAANPLAFAISSGNSSGAFGIDPATGQLTVADPSKFNYETLSPSWEFPALFELLVTVTDTVDPLLNESVRVVVTVTDVNETPVFAGGSSYLPVGAASGVPVYQATATDPDRFQGFTWTITAGNTGGLFAIDSKSGLISPAAVPSAAGSYTLSVRATDSGSPALAAEATVTVEVYSIAAGYTPGFAKQTVYDSVSGSTVANLTSNAKFPNGPDREFDLTELAAGSRGDNYGSTVRAYLFPPVTGTYTFWIASDDSSELRLGTSADPATATARASVSGSTSVNQWTKYSSQTSAGINLTAGQAYYLEVRHKEGSGSDHVEVAWQAVVGGTTVISREVIGRRYLAPHFLNYKPLVAATTVSLYDTAYNGVTVATMSATDLNPGQTRGYAITGGNSTGAFGIDAATGRVSVADRTKLNAATTASYSLTVAATDDGSPAQTGTGVLTVQMLGPSQLATSSLVHEIWDGISGNALSVLYGNAKWPNKPDRVRLVTELDSGTNIADNYGARLRACVIPPTTGSYTFYLASDDEGVLLVSTDSTAANASQAASVSGYTGSREWTKYTSQTSAAFNLTAGQRYFVEGRVKEGGGGDHLAIGWTGPGITSVTVPSGSQVVPYDSNQAPSFAASSYSFSVDANAGPGTGVGTVAASVLSFEKVTYAILSGNPGGFAINPQTGQITLADPFGVTGGQTYVLQVGAQDDGYGRLFPPKEAVVPVTVQVTGVSPNRPPVVTITSPSVTAVGVPAGIGMMLAATVSDDGKPDTPGVTTVAWSTASGPAGAVFESPSAVATAVGFPQPGTYVLRVTASDGELSATDELTVVVGGSSNGNAGPTPVAGSDLAMLLPGGNLVGSVTDDGNPTGGAATYLARASTVWRYRKGTSEASSPVGAWRLTGFSEDSSWATGDLPIGYGNYTNNTLLNDMRGLYSTVYLRKVFQLDPARIPDQLTLELYVDDGAVVWINGTEVARKYVATGQIAYNAVATNHAATWETVTISNARSFLVGGNNVLAVHCVNTSLSGSSDLSWNCSLSTPAQPVAITTQWSKVSGPGEVVFANPSQLASGAGFSAPGIYVLRLTASDGIVTTHDDVTVTVSRPLPVANAGSVTTLQEQPVAVTLAGSDPLGTPLTWQIVNGPAHGVLQGTAPQLTYVPDAGWSGADSFVFKVNNGYDDSLPATVAITVNGKPTAVASSVAVAGSSFVNILLAATDPENSPLTFRVVTAPGKGTLSGIEPNLRYQPLPGASGLDTLVFVANDGAQDSVPATVEIRIDGTPVATAQSITAQAGSSLPVVLAGTDPENALLTFLVTDLPAKGTLTGTAPDLVYTPAPGASGSDTFRFTVNDGAQSSEPAVVTVNINGRPQAAALVVDVLGSGSAAVTLAGSDPENGTIIYQISPQPAKGTLSGSAPDLTYTPQPGTSGNDQFTYTASDGVLTSAPATITIRIDGTPVATAQSITAEAGAAVPVVLAGTDPENAPLTFLMTDLPAKGTLTGTAPDLVYTPTPGASGSDTFRFTVSDGGQSSIPAAVTIDIQAIPVEAWRAEKFGERAGDPVVAGDHADPDFDGLENLLEYALRLDPLAADPAGSRPYVAAGEGSFALVFRRNLAATDVEWLVERSDKLGPGAVWHPVTTAAETISEEGGVRVVRVAVPTAGQAAQFLRLRVSLVPADS